METFLNDILSQRRNKCIFLDFKFSFQQNHGVSIIYLGFNDEKPILNADKFEVFLGNYLRMNTVIFVGRSNLQTSSS